MDVGDAVVGRRVPWASRAGTVDWDEAFEDQMPRVYNFFRYRVGVDAAEDLTSVTFLKAWSARERYRRDLGAFSTWLFTIARRVAVDHARTARRHAPLEAAEGVAGGTDPADDAARGSDARRLARLLAALPDADRELLALKYGAELTNRTIAAQTGWSESNVGTRLHRAIESLRAEWGDPGKGNA